MASSRSTATRRSRSSADGVAPVDGLSQVARQLHRHAARDARTLIPALPFCHVRLKARWYSATYPHVLNHLGDHLRKHRMDLGLQLKEVARRLGAHATSVANWEAGRGGPDLRHLPQVIRFLGYDPRPDAESVSERLTRFRTGRGISQAEMARQLAIDPSTLAKWEVGRREPQGKYLAKVEDVLRRSNPSVQRVTADCRREP